MDFHLEQNLIIGYLVLGALGTLFAACVIALALFRNWRARRTERQKADEIASRRQEADDLLDRLAVLRFSCGAKAVKLGTREANLVSFGCAYDKTEPLREGDVLLHCTGVCNEDGCCPLRKIVSEPIRFTLALKTFAEASGEAESADGDGIVGKVCDNDPTIPALARVCLRLGIKGFVFNTDGQLGFWVPPAPYPVNNLVDGPDDGNQEENRTVPSPDKL